MPALFETTKITLFTKIPSKNTLHSLLQRQHFAADFNFSKSQDYKITTGVATKIKLPRFQLQTYHGCRYQDKATKIHSYNALH